MGWFADKCQKCGARVSKRSANCSACGAPPPGAWRRCPSCRKWVGVESTFCWNCRAELHPEQQDRIAGGRWRRDPDVFALRLQRAAMERDLAGGLHLDGGEAALLLDHGAVKGLLQTGAHSAKSMVAPEIVLLDAAEIGAPVCIEGLRSREGIELDLTVDLLVKIGDDAQPLVDRMIRHLQRLAYTEVVEQLAGTLRQAAMTSARRHDLSGLCFDDETIRTFEHELAEVAGEAIARYGFRLVELGPVEIGGEAADGLRARKAGAVDALAEAEAQLKMADKQRELDQVDGERNLSGLERQQKKARIEHELFMLELERQKAEAEHRAALAGLNGSGSRTCGLCPAGSPPPEALGERITLNTGDLRIHLLAPSDGQPLLLGCSRGCELVCRLFDADGNLSRNASRCISRHHARLWVDRGRVWVADGGADPDTGEIRPSTGGTFLDGMRLKHENRTEIPAKRECVLSLAGARPEADAVFGLRVEVHKYKHLATPMAAPAAERKPETVMGVTLRRCDEVPEVYAVVRVHLPLGLLDPDLDGFCVCRRDGALAMGFDGECRWIVPGATLDNGAVELTAAPHAQFGM